MLKHDLDEAPESSAAKRTKTGPACVSCYKAKVKCDGATPCARCVRLGKQCEPRNCTIGRPRKHPRVSSSWPNDPHAYLDRLFNYFKDACLRAASEQTDRVSSVLGALTLMDQFEGEDPRAVSRKRMWNKVGSHVLSAIGLSPKALTDRAATSLHVWQGENGYTSLTSSQVLQRWEEWVPAHCSCYAAVMIHPALTRICVMGESLRTTNGEWNKYFHSVEERDALAVCGQVTDMSWSPLAHVISPSEMYKAMNNILRVVLTKAHNIGTPAIPCFQSHWQTICVCLDRNFKPIMCLIDLRHEVMCYGAITLQRLECTPLPESEYLAKPDLPKKPGFFESLKSTVMNYFVGKTPEPQLARAPPDPEETPSLASSADDLDVPLSPMQFPFPVPEVTDQDITEMLDLMREYDQEELQHLELP